MQHLLAFIIRLCHTCCAEASKKKILNHHENAFGKILAFKVSIFMVEVKLLQLNRQKEKISAKNSSENTKRPKPLSINGWLVGD